MPSRHSDSFAVLAGQGVSVKERELVDDDDLVFGTVVDVEVVDAG
jgi:hypothetical protein